MCGIAIESFFNLGYSLASLCVFVALFVYLAPRVVTRTKWVPLVSLIFLGCATGIARVDVSQTSNAPSLLSGFTMKTVSISGIILDEPDVREAYTNVVLYVRNVLDGDKKFALSADAHVLARVPVYPELKYGDEVTMTGKVTVPINFVPQDGAKAFDYQSYLAKDGIYYQIYFPKVVVVSHDKGNIFVQKLFALKGWLMKNISQNIPEPESSLAGGITLGTKQSLGDEWLQKFRETGVAHIIVLSGYNIAVVAGIISRLVIFMPLTLRMVMSGFGVVLFAVMVGGGATVVRATIMALIIILARVLGREGDALRALVLAGGLMVFANPMILLNDVSFQLSFSATLALVTLVPVVEKYFKFISSLVLREIIVTTLSTQIFVLPLILYHMGSVSLVGLVSNIFILPVVPFAMLVVALVAVFSWVPLAGSAAAYLSYSVLAYVFLAVDFFDKVPFASLKGISFLLWGLFLAYAILGIYILKNFPKKDSAQKIESSEEVRE